MTDVAEIRQTVVLALDGNLGVNAVVNTPLTFPADDLPTAAVYADRGELVERAFGDGVTQARRVDVRVEIHDTAATGALLADALDDLMVAVENFLYSDSALDALVDDFYYVEHESTYTYESGTPVGALVVTFAAEYQRNG